MNISLLTRRIFLPKLVVIFSTLMVFTGSAGADEIFTVTGTGTGGYSGDGGPAVDAQVSNPRGVAVDSVGNVYIADSANHRVRKVTPGGTISTFAGTGVAGWTDLSGGISLAVNNPLDNPTGVAVDAADNVYIADNGNHRIRMVDAAGIMTTVAGDGGVEFNDADDGQSALNAAIRNPYSVHVAASGNLYILDQGNNSNNGGPRVRVVDALTGLIDTAAGDGDPNGSGGDGGPATDASFDSPYGIYVDANENLYIADSGNHAVRVVDSATGIISTFAGTIGFPGSGGDGGLATDADLRLPRGLSGDAAGNIYIADYNNNVVRRVDNAGNIQLIAGTYFGGYNGTGGAPLTLHLDNPIDVASTAGGLLYIVEFDPDRVRVIGPDSANSPVTDITLSNNTFDDEDPANHIVGTLEGVDADLEMHDFALVAGAGDNDNALFNISGIRLRANDPSTMAPGPYSVRIEADDENDSIFQTDFPLTVQSKNAVPPTITLIGDNPQTITVGGAYVELGATADDDLDGDITGNIVIDASAVDTAVIGMYDVTYTVSDSATPANETVVTRMVNVVAADATAPVITLVGSAAVTVTRGNAYTDAGATAMDDTDGDITANIVTVSNVDTGTVGTYQVTYNVMDAAGNAATEVVRTVTVSDPPPPPPPPPPPSSGGGSFGLFGLLFLLGAVVRRRIFVR